MKRRGVFFETTTALRHSFGESSARSAYQIPLDCLDMPRAKMVVDEPGFGWPVNPTAESCQRCGAIGRQPELLEKGYSQPLTLCAGCMAAIFRACRAATRVDLSCKRCRDLPRAKVELENSGLKIQLACRTHGPITQDEWKPAESVPIAVWSDGEAGTIYFTLVDGSWVRAHFDVHEGEVRTFGIAAAVEDH